MCSRTQRRATDAAEGGHLHLTQLGIDQYQVSTDKRSGITSDPNREDDPQYVVRLVGQVIRVSLKTVKIVKGLPTAFEPAG